MSMNEAPGPHRWFVLPGAIHVRPHPRKVICADLTCPEASTYQVQLPGQPALPFCEDHAKASIQQATGKPADLETMLAATVERDKKAQRGHHSMHCPDLARADDRMDGVEKSITVRWDTALCGAYVPLAAITNQRQKVRCPSCQRKMKRLKLDVSGA